jgi:hypothetical protein
MFSWAINREMMIIIHFWEHLHGIAVDKASIVPDCEILIIFRKSHCLYLGFRKKSEGEPVIAGEPSVNKSGQCQLLWTTGRAAPRARKTIVFVQNGGDIWEAEGNLDIKTDTMPWPTRRARRLFGDSVFRGVKEFFP